MRKIIPIVLATAVTGSAEAAFYQQNLLEGGVGGGFELSNSCDHGFYNCGPGTWISPKHTFSAGDVIDFGQVTIDGSLFTPYTSPTYVYDPASERFVIPPPTTYIWTPQVFSGPFISPNPIGPDSYCDSECEDIFSPFSTSLIKTFSLLYTVPDDGYSTVQFAWVDSYNPFFGNGSHSFTYIPPIPEPPTWAMLFIGFIVVSILRHRVASVAHPNRHCDRRAGRKGAIG